MDNCFIIPARGLATGKSRLAGALSIRERRRLNEFMLCTVLGAVRAVRRSHDRLLVVSPDAELRALAARYDAQFLHEAPGGGLNSALEIAAEAARRGGAGILTVVAADLPFIGPTDLDALLAGAGSGPERAAVIAPDRCGSGTNALLRPSNAPMGFFFGAESFLRHAAAARAAGLSWQVVERDGLARDLDCPEDWRMWRQALQREMGLALPPSELRP